MALTLNGTNTFADVGIFQASKSDWGIDTMIRVVRGASSGLAAYTSSLAQGQAYGGFYLQTWEPQDKPPYATVTLIYKGLISGIPTASAVDETTIQTTSVSTDSPEKATRDIEFFSPQTTWRYITSSRPAYASYNTIANGREASIIRSVITDSTGKRYPGNAPAGLVTALYVVPSNKVIGPHATPIFGTPYFECEDVVQRGYWV